LGGALSFTLAVPVAAALVVALFTTRAVAFGVGGSRGFGGSRFFGSLLEKQSSDGGELF